MATNEAIYTWGSYRTLDGQPAGVVVKASPGQVGGWYLRNAHATLATEHSSIDTTAFIFFKAVHQAGGVPISGHRLEEIQGLLGKKFSRE